MRWPNDGRLSAVVDRCAAGITLPTMRSVRWRADAVRVADVAAAVTAEMDGLLSLAKDEPKGGSIAVAVGSRGVANIEIVVRTVVTRLRAAGYDPFIVPAMGSHGGATAAGQAEVLASYGITEANIGAPVRATMDTVVIGEVDGVPVHLDSHVAEAGRALLVCRIKPHTDFSGSIESGAAKMAAIGLGKQSGAQAIHRLGILGLRQTMPAVARIIASRVLLGALTLVENQFDETALVRALRPTEIGSHAETELLELARAALPNLPSEDIDVLIVDEMGKDISGAGLDPNVTGRWLVNGLPEPGHRQVRCLAVLGLTEASHGNAIGIGLADFIPARLAEQIDLEPFYMNVLTAGWAGLRRGRLPLVLPTDLDVVRAALAASGRGHDARVVWIRDTLHTGVCSVSRALWSELESKPELSLVGTEYELPFDADGGLTPLCAQSLSGRAKHGTGRRSLNGPSLTSTHIPATTMKWREE
jgi:hypothetical protein